MRNAWKSVCTRPCGCLSVTNVPFVVEDACWRNGLEAGVRASTSIGMLSLADAKMAFIRGIY